MGLLRPTRSPVLFQQMLGRGLRLHPAKVTGGPCATKVATHYTSRHPQSDCLVLDLVDMMRGNTVVTLPSLLGLAPTFDAKGDDIVTVFQEMRALAAVRSAL
jgi:ATP-dependent helicase IRC3